jgi:thiamine kinase-like enzyme
MCRTIDSSTEPTFCSTRQTGWSTQDCIKINVAAQGYMVKVPKQHTAESISTCLAEGVRASWAAERGIGPRVVALDEQSGAFATEFIRGRTLSPADVTGRIAGIMALLQKLHSQPTTTWMKHYSPIHAVQSYVDEAKRQASMTLDEVCLVDAVLSHSKNVLFATPTIHVPCHNDYHSQNVMLDEKGQLWAIDFENCDLGDPMWDLAYLTLNLRLKPLDLADQYGCTVEEKSRLPMQYLVAIAHCATWSAIHGPQWATHYRDMMDRLQTAWMDTLSSDKV